MEWRTWLVWTATHLPATDFSVTTWSLRFNDSYFYHTLYAILLIRYSNLRSSSSSVLSQ